MASKQELVDAFAGLGVGPGDTVLAHSSLRKLGPVERGADGVIEALLAAVGPDGTVAVPTHTWGTVNAQQPVFHQLCSPSIVGTLTNVFRLRPETVRSLHPTHSVAAIGARARELVEGHERDSTPCSTTSPYGKLVAWGGKILFIGVTLDCCTFFHGCEEWAGCPWLFTKEQEPLWSVRADGTAISVPSYRHAGPYARTYRALEDPMAEIGALVARRLGSCTLSLLDARKAADWLVPALRKNPCLVLEPGTAGC